METQRHNILTPFLAKMRFWYQNEAGNTSYFSATKSELQLGLYSHNTQMCGHYLATYLAALH